VYFTHRTALTDKFHDATLLAMGTFASPVLASDCSALYAVAGGRVMRFHN
jgi:hypothetical protein